MLGLGLTSSCPLGSCTDHVERVRVLQEEGNRGILCTTYPSPSPSTRHPTNVREELLRTHGSRAGRDC
jgi:hypothetical protein